MLRRTRIGLVVGSAALGLLPPAHSHAAIITGGSTLLDAAYANQLEDWLGEGPIQLTSIYKKSPGDTSSNFHAAVDDNGRTFVVMFATENSGVNSTIGGYNPRSWNSSEGPHVTLDDAARTAFVFNLSTGNLYRQRFSTDYYGLLEDLGKTQTYNGPNSGPVFGEVGDIVVNGDMTTGFSNLGSYGEWNTTGLSIADGLPYDGINLQYGAIEVFAISNATPVPEPGTWAMLCAGLMLLGAVARREPRRHPGAGDRR